MPVADICRKDSRTARQAKKLDERLMPHEISRDASPMQ